MTITLPPLPSTDYRLGVLGGKYERDWISNAEAWDGFAMEAYATAAVEADRASAPPDGSWRQAIDEALIMCALDCPSSHDDPRAALSRLIDWHVQVALDPSVSSAAQALLDTDRAQREEPAPTSLRCACHPEFWLGGFSGGAAPEGLYGRLYLHSENGDVFEYDRAQRGEPVAIYRGRCVIDCGEHGHHDIEMLKLIPTGTKLYTAPQPAHNEAEVQELMLCVADWDVERSQYEALVRRILGVPQP